MLLDGNRTANRISMGHWVWERNGMLGIKNLWIKVSWELMEISEYIYGTHLAIRDVQSASKRADGDDRGSLDRVRCHGKTRTLLHPMQ